MKKSFLIITLLIGLRSLAQQEMMISQYMFNGLFLNPAYAGSHDYTEASALYRQQWATFKGAPVSQIASVDGRILSKNMGWGAILTNDRIGVTYKTDLYGNYAYHIKTSEKGKLSLGIRGGFSLYRALLSQLTVWDGNDQVFTNNISTKFLPNAGTGIYYYMPKFYAGLSCPNMLSYAPGTSVNLAAAFNDQPNLIRHYYFNTGYVYEVSDNLHIKPSVLVKYVKNAPVEADLNLNVLINRAFWVGASYRSGDGIVGLLEYQHNNWRLGYAYDFALTKMQKHSFGSHEIMFAYMFKPQETIKIKNPRFF